MKRQLSIDDVLKRQHYKNILFVIEIMQIQKKKITFKHLKYALVENTTDKLTDIEKRELKDFFNFPNEEIKEKLKNVNELSNFLHTLLRLRLIEKGGRKRNKQYYTVTNKCIVYRKRYIITERVEMFLDYVFNNRRPLNKSIIMLDVFLDDIEASFVRLIPSK